MVAVSPRHQFGQFRHMFLKFENKSGTLPVDDADADTEHVFGIDFYLMFVNQFHQFRIVVDGGGQLVVITPAGYRSAKRPNAYLPACPYLRYSATEPEPASQDSP